MATATSSAPAQTGSLTKQSIKPISDMLQALVTAGVLTQTTDTGQVNWSTINDTDTTFATTPYEIYSLNDSLAATYPIYLKFSYNAGSGSGSAPNCIVQLSTSTNGSGGLGTNVSSAMTYRTRVGNFSNDTTPRAV